MLKILYAAIVTGYLRFETRCRLPGSDRVDKVIYEWRKANPFTITCAVGIPDLD